MKQMPTDIKHIILTITKQTCTVDLLRFTR